MPVEIKRDKWLWAFAALLVAMTFALVWHHDVTFKEGAAFVVGALAMPGLFGTRKKPDDDNHDGGVTVPVSDAPGPTVQKIGERSLPAIITPVSLVALIWSALALTALTAACAAAASPDQKAAAADISYASDQLACVDKYDTRAEADACRERVRKQWHLDAGKADR